MKGERGAWAHLRDSADFQCNRESVRQDAPSVLQRLGRSCTFLAKMRRAGSKVTGAIKAPLQVLRQNAPSVSQNDRGAVQLQVRSRSRPARSHWSHELLAQLEASGASRWRVGLVSLRLNMIMFPRIWACLSGCVRRASNLSRGPAALLSPKSAPSHSRSPHARSVYYCLTTVSDSLTSRYIPPLFIWQGFCVE